MIEPKEIIRTRRRTIALVIDSDGELIVRAPFYASDREIMRFVSQKQDWIMKKTQEMHIRKAKRPGLGLEEGCVLYYLGRTYSVERTETMTIHVDGDCIRIPRNADAKAKLTAWYKKEASKLIKPRVRLYAERMGVEPEGVRITSARTRWGSCSYTNHVNFSWHLVMCPPDVIDYVVVHELCHIWHKNHSRLFWESVAQMDPDYKVHRSWLKSHGYLMEENW